jgi:hypothetical protein
MYILRMYKYKHPRTWDEILPYVQHNNNRALHSSTSHSPFHVGMRFQPLGPIDVALPLSTTQTKYSHVQSEAKKSTRSLSGFSTSSNRSMRFCRNPMLSTSSAMINTGYRTSFRYEIRSGYICRKSALQGPIGSSTHFAMGLTLSPRMWVAMILSSTLHPSLACTQCSIWTSFDHIFHHYWTPQRS